MGLLVIGDWRAVREAPAEASRLGQSGASVFAARALAWSRRSHATRRLKFSFMAWPMNSSSCSS